MRASHVVLVLVAGAISAFYAYLPAPQDREAKLAEMTRILGATLHEVASRKVVQSGEQFRSFAPSSGSVPPPAAIEPPTRSASTESKPVPAPRLLSGPSRVIRATERSNPSDDWAAVVIAEPERASVASPLSRLAAVKPSSAAARYELVRDLQAELKRVGCFGGEISGAWGTGTKQAMTAFMDRVNARLPIEEPDYVLLALVKAHPADACADSCPQGQVRAESGRCVPSAVVAQATPKSTTSHLRRSAARPDKTGSSNWTTVTKAEPRYAPTATDRPAATGVTVAAAPAPLPGRMAIGGPNAAAKAARSEAQANASATRVAGLPPDSMSPAVPSSDTKTGQTGEVTGSTGPKAGAATLARQGKRLARSGPPPARSYRTGRYVPPPPHMLGSFYNDKPAYTAARRRW